MHKAPPYEAAAAGPPFPSMRLHPNGMQLRWGKGTYFRKRHPALRASFRPLFPLVRGEASLSPQPLEAQAFERAKGFRALPPLCTALSHPTPFCEGPAAAKGEGGGDKGPLHAFLDSLSCSTPSVRAARNCAAAALSFCTREFFTKVSFTTQLLSSTMSKYTGKKDFGCTRPHK